MPNGTDLAVTQAGRLNEIGFPEFTAKLITDTFDALIAANMRQTQSYIELVQQISKTLTQYINDTRDDIGGEELMQFLALVVPPDNATAESEPTKIAENSTITDTDLTNLNTALAVPGHPAEGDIAADNQVAVPTDTPLNQSHVQVVLQAIANRLAANKYGLLKEMVKLGILRLVVENGTIETRLTFTTYGSTFYESKATQYHRDSFQFKAKARTGWFVSLWAKASASTRYTSINVNTTKETNRDISGSRVQIYGSVVINFKTDYQPLAA